MPGDFFSLTAIKMGMFLYIFSEKHKEVRRAMAETEDFLFYSRNISISSTPH